jgi:T4 RnlA family RNA ligase
MLNILNDYKERGLLYSQTHPILPLTIWNYTEKVQYESLWDEVTLATRGLVTDSSGRVVARPFSKFFNLEEGKHQPTQEFEVFEKMDGSLGIVFVWEGQVVYATRGSFASDQAKWMATWGDRYNFSNILVEGYTYLFEIIYPENMIVVNYGGESRLVLLGVIKTDTGEETSWSDLSLVDGWDLVKRYDGISDYTLLKGMVESNREGFVVRFSNGNRVKIKGEEYLRLHRIMTNLSTTAIWEVLSGGGDVLSTLTDIPDEFYDKIHQYSNELMDKYTKLEDEYIWIFELLSKSDVSQIRSGFAELAKKYKYPAILFRMYDDKDYSEIIWKIIRPEFGKL